MSEYEGPARSQAINTEIPPDSDVLKSRNLDRKIKENTIKLFIYRAFNMGVSYAFVPLLIGYLDKKVYGVWLTILSVTSWIGLFDIGIGNGLRNKLTESLAKGDLAIARRQVSSAFALLGGISLAALIVFVAVAQFLNWHTIFNIGSNIETELNLVVVLMVFSFIVSFLFSLNNSIAYARQQSSFSSLNQFIFNLFLLILTCSLVLWFKPGNLLSLSLAYAGSMLLSTSVMSFILFKKNLDLLPKFSYVSMCGSKELVTLGARFFILQFASLIIFSTNNIIITQVAGPEEVAIYNIIYKIFAIVLVFQSIILTPLWSGFTDAYSRDDYGWLRNKLKQLNKVTGFILILIFIIILLFKYILLFWLNDLQALNYPLITMLAIYVWLMVFTSNYAYLFNGCGKITLSLMISIVVAIINVPLAILFSKYFHLGTLGVVISNIICLLPGVIIGPIQANMILNKRACGIWNH